MQSKPFSDNEYLPFKEFANSHPLITFGQFDSLILDGLNLFAHRESIDFDALEEIIDRITSAVPSIRRLATRPITRLTDRDEIMPIETVKIINAPIPAPM